MHRFAPRRPGSIWSAVNLKRMDELIALGVVSRRGRQTFDERDPKKAGLYSFENRPSALAPTLERRFRANAPAWRFFRAPSRPAIRKCVSSS